MDELIYFVVRSKRRTISIELDPAANVVVRAPQTMSNIDISAFVESKRSWIEKHKALAEEKFEKKKTSPTLSEAEKEALVEKALQIISEKVEHFSKLIGVTYGNITIRNQKTVWGSCSAKGNLNFNYLLAALPEELLDYVVVHELCHRIELNHSPRFWAEVEKILPNYKELKNQLKEKSIMLM